MCGILCDCSSLVDIAGTWMVVGRVKSQMNSFHIKFDLVEIEKKITDQLHSVALRHSLMTQVCRATGMLYNPFHFS